MSTHTTTDDPIIARIRHLEKRISQLESRKENHLSLAATDGGELVLRRTRWACLWLAVDKSGARHYFLNYGSEFDVPNGRRRVPRLPGHLVAGDVIGSVFLPYDEALPEYELPDFGVETVAIGPRG